MNTPANRTQKRVVDLWNAAAPADAYFWNLPPVLRHMNAKVSGDPGTDWIDWVSRSFLAEQTPLQRCVSLCCGRGHLERTLIQRGVAAACDAFDIADQSIAAARRLAQEAGLDGIQYECRDVNQIHLEAERYDAAFVHDGLHHLVNLEHVYDEVRRSLKPGGWFVVHEYVGPSQFQFTDRQVEVMNATLKLLPLKYRVRIRRQRRIEGTDSAMRQMPRSPSAWVTRIWEKARSGRLFGAVQSRLTARVRAWRGKPVYKERIDRPTIAEMNLWDPSEAIRSAEIIPLLHRFFQVVEIRPCGGTVFNYLLDDIAGNFDPSQEEDLRVLEMVLCIEDTLLESDDLHSDFAVVVARKSAS